MADYSHFAEICNILIIDSYPFEGVKGFTLRAFVSVI